MWREEATFINPELMYAWMSYTEKLYSTLECDILFRELHEYRNGTGTFSYALAREEISMMAPVNMVGKFWWKNSKAPSISCSHIIPSKCQVLKK